MRITSRAGIFDALFDDTNFMTFTPAVLLLAGRFGARGFVLLDL